MPRNKSKDPDMAAPEPGASIVEASFEAGGKNATKTSGLKNRTVRKSTGQSESTRRTKAARKSTPASVVKADQTCAEELTVLNLTSEKTGAEATQGCRQSLAAETSIQERIALLAYSYWETRGCPGGSPEEDWFRAERELLKNLALLRE